MWVNQHERSLQLSLSFLGNSLHLHQTIVSFMCSHVYGQPSQERITYMDKSYKAIVYSRVIKTLERSLRGHMLRIRWESRLGASPMDIFEYRPDIPYLTIMNYPALEYQPLSGTELVRLTNQHGTCRIPRKSQAL